MSRYEDEELELTEDESRLDREPWRRTRWGRLRSMGMGTPEGARGVCCSDPRITIGLPWTGKAAEEGVYWVC